MAGLGSRFDSQGYILPKHLLPVSGKPMILKVIEGMPKSDKWIFILRKEHITKYKIDQLIKTQLPGAIIISIDYTTEGQACTCMLAKDFLDPEEELFIGACDHSFLYNEEKFQELKNNPDINAIFLTFTKKELLRKTPRDFGWFRLEEDNETISDISIKIPVSEDPFNDHAVTGSFYFKKAKYFMESVNLMIQENYRINNEFYIDSLPIFLRKLDKKSVIFDVDLYVTWGKPDELHEYENIEFILNNSLPEEILTEEQKRYFPLWKKYFSQESNWHE